MKKRFMALVVALSIVILLSPCTPQAAGPASSTNKKAVTSSDKTAQPQPGGIYKVMIRSNTNNFGYPPRMSGASKDYATPFFDRLLSVGDDGKYKPGLALGWDVSKDGKTITFKLRQGVKFHDGAPFNAQAVKANLDKLIAPNPVVIGGITSVDVIDDYTVKLNLSEYNNLILHHFAANSATWMYSLEAVKKNGEEWAMTHPVGTGPFMLKDYQPNVSLTLVKNPDYWQKGLPYLDGIEIAMSSDPMVGMLSLKAGQTHALYAILPVTARLKDEGYLLQGAPGSLYYMTFDTKNSKIFSNPKVRLAIEYAIDKEAICNGPGEGFYKPVYQIVSSDSPDYNKACPPRKYDPAKAKKLLAEAGYPNGFSFKIFFQDGQWKDGWVAIQSYLDKVGIKMEIVNLNIAAYNLIRAGGKIESGAAAFASFTISSNTLFTLDSFWRSNIGTYGYVAIPTGIDKFIDQAKLSREPAAVHRINQQSLKLLYDDETVVPLCMSLRMAVMDKSVQNTGWFIHGDSDNNEFGTRTWLKK